MKASKLFRFVFKSNREKDSFLPKMGEIIILKNGGSLLKLPVNENDSMGLKSQKIEFYFLKNFTVTEEILILDEEYLKVYKTKVGYLVVTLPEKVFIENTLPDWVFFDYKGD